MSAVRIPGVQLSFDLDCYAGTITITPDGGKPIQLTAVSSYNVRLMLERAEHILETGTGSLESH